MSYFANHHQDEFNKRKSHTFVWLFLKWDKSDYARFFFAAAFFFGAAFAFFFAAIKFLLKLFLLVSWRLIPTA